MTVETAASDLYRHEIRVTWGDCDPAKIAYTGRIPGFALDAINGWWEHHLGGDGWFQMELDRNIGTPFVHMSLDFLAPITPRHRLICEVAPVRLGTSSIEFRVIGRQKNVSCFEGRFICVFTIADRFERQPAPPDIRALVEPLLQSHLARDPAA
ncbi:acyl-CoA thioesterase [Primorskyibacter sp. S87]|uniref:acyl-CoA thioesterase n=1 Tax=Primorskyibacter sp. S87 TaxID=3415126 RepID=UPI003C797844